MTRAYRSEWHDAVIVEQASGLLHLVTPDGCVSMFSLPGDAVELLDPDAGREQVLGDVRAALADVRMSKAARAAVLVVLDDLAPETAS